MNENAYSPLPPETTEVLYGNENIQRKVLESFSWVKEGLDGCVESDELPMNVVYDAIWNGFVELKKKGVKLRSITEVTPDNISYVKKSMELFETRHTTGLRSNFGIVDKRECLLHSVSHEDQPLSHAIITNAKALVEAQCFLFETLWKNAVPAEEKIREIEEGMKSPFIETLRDHLEIQKLGLELIESAKREIQMLLLPRGSGSGANTFLKEEREQMIIQLFKAATGRGIGVRILTSKDMHKQIEKLIEEQKKVDEEITRQGNEKEDTGLVPKAKGKFQIHLVDILHQQQRERLHSKVSILIVDSKLSLVEDLERYNKDENPNGLISLATYSNSEATVLTYISIFETLWTRTELTTQRP